MSIPIIGSKRPLGTIRDLNDVAKNINAIWDYLFEFENALRKTDILKADKDSIPEPTPEQINTPSLIAGSFLDNTPTTGYVSWQNAKIRYNGVEYNITDGNTNFMYIYWDSANPTVFFATSTLGDLNIGNRFLIVVNDGGIVKNYIAKKWAPNTVNDINIVNNSITSIKVAANAIGTNHIQDLAITNSKIANLAVDSAKIADLAVTNAKIANLAVNNIKILTNSAQYDRLTYNPAWRIVTANNVNDAFISFNIVGNTGINIYATYSATGLTGGIIHIWQILELSSATNPTNITGIKLYITPNYANWTGNFVSKVFQNGGYTTYLSTAGFVLGATPTAYSINIYSEPVRFVVSTYIFGNNNVNANIVPIFLLSRGVVIRKVATGSTALDVDWTTWGATNGNARTSSLAVDLKIDSHSTNTMTLKFKRGIYIINNENI